MPSQLRPVLLGLAATFGFAGFCLAQQPAPGGEWGALQKKTGFERSNFGSAVARAGDVDGDGVEDWLAGAPESVVPGSSSIQGDGVVVLYSGRNGQILRVWLGQPSSRLGSSLVAVGDVDGDTVPDFAVGALGESTPTVHKAGAVFLYSGATGAELWRFDGHFPEEHLGETIALAGDLDQDGVQDLIFGAPRSSAGSLSLVGRAYVYSSVSHQLLFVFGGTAQKDKFGTSVAGVGDLDGDGTPDLAIGARGRDENGLQNSGSVYLYSGATGAQLGRLDGEQEFDHFSIVAGPGDLDGDSVPELLIGAPDAGPNLYGSEARDTGKAYVYSGRTGALLFEFQGDGQAGLGSKVAAAGDIDGDNVPDLLIGAPGYSDGYLNESSAQVYSGADGSLFARVYGDSRGGFGSSLDAMGDLDGDGFGEILVGAKSESVGGANSSGAAYLMSLDPFLDLNTDAWSASSGLTLVFSLDFPDRYAGKQYRLLASVSGKGPTALTSLMVPLTWDHLTDRLYYGVMPPQLKGWRGRLDAAGNSVALAFPPPSLSQSIGQRLYFAAVVWDGQQQRLTVSSAGRNLEIVP